MAQKILGCPFEVKELTDTGTFEGLASVYGNVDLGGDICMPGCFKEFVLTKDNQIRILSGHNLREPIGKGKLTDTHLGLAIKGTLNLQVSRARDVHALMKDGIIDGLSIGYNVLENGAEIRPDGVRLLKALKLFEVSTTVFPMNEEAQVSAVKHLHQITSIRDYEDFLREVGGFSKAQAKILAASWKDLPGQRDVDEGDKGDQKSEAAIELMGFLERIAVKG